MLYICSDGFPISDTEERLLVVFTLYTRKNGGFFV